jgi:type II secretory ATPase GspE/PulE/Tfp pilus assembly ATPase PilB-like protein
MLEPSAAPASSLLAATLVPSLVPSLAQHVVFSMVSWIKPILLLGTLIPYLWAVTKIEADTRRFIFNVPLWNGILVGAGIVGVLAALAIPIFWIGWPVMILVYAGSLYAYWQYRDKRVPETARFRLFSKDLGKRMDERRARKALADSVLKFADAKGHSKPPPLRDSPEFAVHMALENVIAPALERRAGRIELLAAGANQPVIPTHTIDGVRYKSDAIAPNIANEAIDYIKKLAGLDLQDRRRRQSAEMRISGPTRDAVATVTVWGSNAGQSLRIDFDRVKSMQIPFDNLGLLPGQLDLLKRYADPQMRHGIVLVSTPPGQGLTTLGYSLLSRHDAYTCNIKTLERQVDVELEGVDHAQFNPANPTVDFATNLQSILRRDPDVVFVSDVSDANTARIVTAPGMQGPLLYVGIPAESVAGAVSEWFRTVGDMRAASRGLVCVVNARLIRKVCEACRQPIQPSPELLKSLGVPAGKSVQIFRQNGKVQVKNRIEDCPVCQGTGYFGQTAVFEIMPVDDAMRETLATGDFKAAYSHARRENRLVTLKEAAMAKVRDGVTTADEVVRVFPPARPAQPSATAASKSTGA